MLTFVRAATQFARRVKVLGDIGCKWLIRATRNSDEGRNPVAKRHSVLMSASRLVCGSPKVGNSVDHWPGKKAPPRPSASFPGGEPSTEPVEPQQKFVMLNADASVHARQVEYRDRTCAPPKCVVEVFAGRAVRAPRFPLCELGLPRPEPTRIGDESIIWRRKSRGLVGRRVRIGSRPVRLEVLRRLARDLRVVCFD